MQAETGIEDREGRSGRVRCSVNVPKTEQKNIFGS